MNFLIYYYLNEEKIPNWNEIINSNNELKSAIKVLKKINDLGYEALIVGGTPRDLLLGKEISDVDIATSAPIKELEKHFKNHDIGKNKDFNVIVIDMDGYSFEVAAYRSDVYDDYSKGVGATKTIIAKDFKSDSARRDFGMNSLGVDADGNINDNWGGVNDIKNKIVKAIGNPLDRFKEDEVRSLRGVRFASRFDFDIDPKTIEAMKKNAPEIAKVSRERIYKELNKMAEGTGPQFARAIKILNDTGLLQYILPEVAKLAELEHSPEHHPEKDESGKHTVLAHVIEALKSNPLKDRLINLSVLLHDVGKATTHELDADGKHRYFGHAQAAENIIEDLAKRLTIDNDTKKKLQFAAINHMKIHELLKMSNSKIAELMNNDGFEVLMKVAEADAKARGYMFDEKEWQQITNKIAELTEKFKDRKAIEAIKKVVNGNRVMQLKGITKPGPEVGKIINQTVQWILDNNINISDTDKIAEFIKRI